MANNIQESIFQAIDTITSKRLNDLEYDKTIKCTIADNSNAAKGEYTVTDGVSTFLAYSNDTTYSVDQKVYVNIPNGDMKNQKIITGKYVDSDENSKYYNYVSPIQDFLDITGNIIDDNIEGNILANGKEKEVRLWNYIPETPIKGYSLLGISCDFMSWLKSLNVVSGTYGIRIDIVGKTENTSENNSINDYYSLYLSTDDMYGNPYNFETYYTQEKLFDISMIDQITNISATLYQNGDFLTGVGDLAASTDEEGNELVKNIFIQQLYLSFGFDVNDYEEDGVLIGTLDSLQYQIKSDNNKRVYAKWIHLADDRKYIIDEANEMPENAKIHWYRFNLAEGVMDPIAGAFWDEVNPQADANTIAEYNKNMTYYDLLIRQTENEKARLEELKQIELDNVSEDAIDSSDPEYKEKYDAIIDEYNTNIAALKEKLNRLYEAQVSSLIDSSDFPKVLAEIEEEYGNEDNDYYLAKNEDGRYYFTDNNPNSVYINGLSKTDILDNINNIYDGDLDSVEEDYKSNYEAIEASRVSELNVLSNMKNNEINSIVINGYTKANAAAARTSADSILRNIYEDFLLKLYQLQPPTIEIEDEIFNLYKENDAYLQDINFQLDEENYKYDGDSYSIEREKLLKEYLDEYNNNNVSYANSKDEQIEELTSSDNVEYRNIYNIVKNLNVNATNLEIASDDTGYYYNLIENNYEPNISEEDALEYETLINRDNAIINELTFQLENTNNLTNNINISYIDVATGITQTEKININNKYLNEIVDENTVEEQYLTDYNSIKNNESFVKENFYIDGIYESQDYIEEYNENILPQNNQIEILQETITQEENNLEDKEFRLENKQKELEDLLASAEGNSFFGNTRVEENGTIYYLTDEQYEQYLEIKRSISEYENDISNLNPSISQNTQQLNLLLIKRNNDLTDLQNKYYNALLTQELNKAILVNKYNRFLSETYTDLETHKDFLNNIESNNEGVAQETKRNVLNQLTELQLEYQTILTRYNNSLSSNLENYNNKVNSLSTLDEYTSYYREQTEIYYNDYISQRNANGKDSIPTDDLFKEQENYIEENYKSLFDMVNQEYDIQKEKLEEQKEQNYQEAENKYENNILNLKYSIESSKQQYIDEKEKLVYRTELERQEKIALIEQDIRNQWGSESANYETARDNAILELTLGVQLELINEKYDADIQEQTNKILNYKALIKKLSNDYYNELAKYATFNNIFAMNTDLQNEKFKVIIEYPSKESIIDTFTSNDQILSIREELKNNTYCVNVIDELLYLDADDRNEICEDLVAYFFVGKEASDDRKPGNSFSKEIVYNGVTYYVTVEELSQYSDLVENLEDYTEKISQVSEIINSELSIVNYITSNILEFENEDLVANSASVELVKGLEIECDIAGYNGVYRIYDANGQIISKSENMKKRLLTAKYNSLMTGDSNLDQAEKIIWKIPVSNTMIYYPTAGVEYGYSDDDKLVGEPKEENGYFVITRMGVAHDSSAGSLEADSTQQYFRIKENYSQGATNNIVYCQIIRNKRVYEASYELYFGPSGTNGTDYTFTLELANKVPALTFNNSSYVEIIPHVYDYEDKDITSQFKQKIKYRWYSAGETAWKQLKRTKANIYYENYGTSIQKKCDPTTTLIPDPMVRFYNAEGVLTQCSLSFYEKNGYYINNNGIFEVISDSAITIHQDEEDKTRYFLTINSSIDDLTIDKCNYYILQGYIDDVVTISEGLQVSLTSYLPVAIRLDEKYTQFDGPDKICYDSSGINPTYYKEPCQIYTTSRNVMSKVSNIKWSMSFGADTNYNVSKSYNFYPQISKAGILTPPTMFLVDNGVQISIVGKLNEQIIWIQPIRIYQNQYSSAMLNSWDGNLTIDEKNGTILSAMVGAGKKDSQNRFNGVLMGNVEETAGYGVKEIGLYGFHEGEQSFGFKIDGTGFIGKSGRGQIRLDGNQGTIQSGNFNSGLTGMKIDLDGSDGISSSLEAYGQGGTFVLDTSNGGNRTLLEIKDNERDTLLHIGSSDNPQYYIQSSGYQNPETNLINGQGSKFDLANATLNVYGSGGAILIDGKSDTKLFQIRGYNSNNAIVTLMNVSKDNYYLQSKDYQDSKKGIKFNTSKNKINAIGNGGSIELNADSTTALFRIQNSSNSTLMNISENSYYIQSNNKNIKFDLSGNKFIVSGSGGSVNINGDGTNSLFTIKNANNIILMNVASNSYYLQTANYNSTNHTGTKIDLNSGKITSYNFNVQAYNSSNQTITINSGAATYPFNINNKFKVKWDGSLDIGGGNFTVSSNGTVNAKNLNITGGSIKIGSKFSVNSSGVLTASGANISGKITATSGTFTGTVYATAGTIGGCKIKNGVLKINSANIGTVKLTDLYLGSEKVTTTTIKAITSLKIKARSDFFDIFGGYRIVTGISASATATTLTVLKTGSISTNSNTAGEGGNSGDWKTLINL